MVPGLYLSVRLVCILFATDMAFILLPVIELSESNMSPTIGMFLDHSNHWRILIDFSMIALIRRIIYGAFV